MLTYQSFLIRPWQPADRAAAAAIIGQALAEYGLGWEPDGADRDVLDVEACYQAIGGEFWVVEQAGQVVGTAAYYPIARGIQAVEIRKMYLRAEVRGLGLGRFLLGALERTITARGFRQIWVETASVLCEAVCLYERAGYRPATIADLGLPGHGEGSDEGSLVETDRCDRVYVKDLAPPAT
jgi:putative acetyltransferase